MTNEQLIEEAVIARRLAHAPYSGYKVGAALLCRDDSVYHGCNIENAAFSPTVCAERVAFFKAVSEGKNGFTAIAVVGGKDRLVKTTPCGVCRQVMAEFCNSDFKIITLDENLDCTETTLSVLLPNAFGNYSL